MFFYGNDHIPRNHDCFLIAFYPKTVLVQITLPINCFFLIINKKKVDFFFFGRIRKKPCERSMLLR